MLHTFSTTVAENCKICKKLFKGTFFQVNEFCWNVFARSRITIVVSSGLRMWKVQNVGAQEMLGSCRLRRAYTTAEAHSRSRPRGSSLVRYPGLHVQFLIKHRSLDIASNDNFDCNCRYAGEMSRTAAQSVLRNAPVETFLLRYKSIDNAYALSLK